jgi:hypothetical protein
MLALCPDTRTPAKKILAKSTSSASLPPVTVCPIYNRQDPTNKYCSEKTMNNFIALTCLLLSFARIEANPTVEYIYRGEDTTELLSEGAVTHKFCPLEGISFWRCPDSIAHIVGSIDYKMTFWSMSLGKELTEPIGKIHVVIKAPWPRGEKRAEYQPQLQVNGNIYDFRRRAEVPLDFRGKEEESEVREEEYVSSIPWASVQSGVNDIAFRGDKKSEWRDLSGNRTLQTFVDYMLAAEKARKPEAEKSEQAGTGQPATRPESKSEGNDKPQPEAEGRSR